ncbi:ATP-binding protein [uncultured Methanobrevibacter sp.]|uniref:AAA family ATPase n=1 Tax=uncultured Methanobrevibacter sp. TaxID=253161 RepID=UPI0025CF43DC|nr:BREX system ATP-binding domain-containing protein [uncultured Methanobrevibacter sp.]
MSIVPLYVPINEIDKYFYNRTEDIKKIEYYLNSLEMGISQSLLIRGVRGVGKTFLLQKLKQDSKKNFLVSYIDISRIVGFDDTQLTAQSVLLELLDEMNNTIYDKINDGKKITFLLKKLINKLKIKDFSFSKGTHIAEIPIPATEDNYKKISKFVMEYPQNVVEDIDGIDGFIIIIDEFQMLKKLENPESFFWLLRSYSQFQSNVSYVMSGSISQTSDAIEMLNGATGAFGGRMIQINIDPFTKKETKSYFNDRFPEITFTDDGFNRFYEYTKGIPMYINSFYNALSSHETYDEELIDYIFLNNMDQILVMWIRIWGTLNKYEKRIICTMLNKENISWSELERKLDMSPATLTKYIKTLQDKGIIKYYGGYYNFEDLMLKTWLTHEKERTGVYPQ